MEVINLEKQIKQKAESQKKAGIELESTCQVCLKTKFADGVGHLCNYCNVRCCARCGGKVTLRSNKIIWVCILCRKKQELLIKSGKWMQGGVSQHNDPILRKIELDMAPTPTTPASSSLGPSASISSLYSKTVPTMIPSRPEHDYRLLGETRPSSSLSSHSSMSHRQRPLVVGGDPMRPKLPRQRSLQQDMYRDVLGPAPGHSQGPHGPRYRPSLVRASSEGGDDMYDPASAGYGGQAGIRGHPGNRAGQHNISISGLRIGFP